MNALYNGNIAETQWATNSDNGVLRTYSYKYDNLNRLKAGIYKKGTVLDMYNESLTYDKNGNIMGLTRNGNSETALQQIDNLVYSYGPANSINQLTKVVDNATTYKAGGFVDSAANTVDDYSYDANGNMTKDNNKNITAIAYNHLNLPTKITFASTGNIVYIYNAAGQKVQKIVNETNKAAITTDYLGGYQYDNALLKFFPTAEGYVEPSGSSYKYVYQYKDHLGNVRLSYDKTLAIKEESNFYPFGLKQEGYNNVKSGVENKYKFNGKELQDELGLNMYDYGARNYDPALGRWMNIDPLAEKYFYSSTYSYVCNDPVNYIDPNGMDRYYMNDQGRTVLALKEKAADILFFGGKNNESIVDTNKDGKQDSKDGITIKTKGLLGQLTQQKGEKTSLYTSTVKQSETAENDMLNVFHFAANNTKVEFSLKFYEKGGENLISLGTYNSEWSSPGFGAYGKVKANKGYHNHPYDDIYTSKHTEENGSVSD